MTVDHSQIRVNRKIRVSQVRLIGADGSQIGVVSIDEALAKAAEAELDLIEISPEAVPPVCKILDFKKYCYQLEKREKENKKKQKVVEIKEIKFTPKIEEHDYQTKLRHCEKFLERGDRVKVSMFFRGREMAHVDIGQAIIERVKKDLSAIADVERDFGLRGSMIILVFTPKAQK